MVRIIFLGVGGWVSEPFLGLTSFIIESENNRRILIDAGEGTYKSLRQCGYDINDIDLMVLTHRHGDHVLGVPTLVLMAVHKYGKNIEIMSTKDVIKSIEKLLEITGINYLLNRVKFIEVKSDDIIHYHQFAISFLNALHTIPSISIKVEVSGKCIVYSGDTKYNPKLIEFARNCNVLIHEVSDYTNSAHIYGHSSYEDALRIASMANVDIFIPIHFYVLPLPIDMGLSNSKKFKIFVPMPCSTLNI